MMLTFTVNVPMNEALAAIAVPGDIAAARDSWRDYSPRWQVWNQARALASGIALVFAALGVARL
nr:anthrone oxygenase family protein [Rhizobium leguminosarum]